MSLSNKAERQTLRPGWWYVWVIDVLYCKRQSCIRPGGRTRYLRPCSSCPLPPPVLPGLLEALLLEALLLEAAWGGACWGPAAPSAL